MQGRARIEKSGQCEEGQPRTWLGCTGSGVARNAGQGIRVTGGVNVGQGEENYAD